jgi:hypothetical protein
MTLTVKPAVYREMFERAKSLEKENEYLREKLVRAHRSIESRNKLIGDLMAAQRWEADRQQREASRAASDAMLKQVFSND